MVEYPGIEPGVPEGGGFTVHCITIDASTPMFGAVDGNRTHLSLADNESPSQRATTAYWYSVRDSNPFFQLERLAS